MNVSDPRALRAMEAHRVRQGVFDRIDGRRSRDSLRSIDLVIVSLRFSSDPIPVREIARILGMRRGSVYCSLRRMGLARSSASLPRKRSGPGPRRPSLRPDDPGSDDSSGRPL